jgi:hypothetical protein
MSTSTPSRRASCSNGAGDRSRTYDLRITNALLYQLSYTGTFINGGGTPAVPADAGLTSPTSNCTITVTGTTIACAMLNAPTQIAAATITWTRAAATGEWSCATSGATDKTLAPKSCAQP